MSTRCRACESAAFYEVLDLGNMPLAGDFRPAGESNCLYPLAIDGCESCGLLQVRKIVDPSTIFTSDYSFSSSTVPGLVQHFGDYAKEVALPVGEVPSKRLLEVGCNDGVFLDPLGRVGYEVVGIDASENVVGMARNKGLDVCAGFFGLQTAKDLLNRYGHFDVITCSNVFAHNPLVNEFIEAVDALLDPRQGEFWVEVHSAHKLYDGLQWDCFYHEHCFYWTIHALRKCLEKHGYKLMRYKTTSMHGGALRAVFSKSKGSPKIELVEKELTSHCWQDFTKRCERSRDLIQGCVEKLPIHYAYGAAGRAVTLINWTEIGGHLDFVVDGSPLRFGKSIPNTSLPIISEEIFFKKEDLPPWCFVTAHNYLEGIKKKVNSHFPDKHTWFVTPLPCVAIQ